MPIIIKDFTWHQSSQKVSIDIPLKKANNADIFITESYLKISAPPSIFEAFLPAKIDVDKSVASKTDTQIKFELTKIEQENWPNVQIQLDAQTAKLKRKEALEWLHAYEANRLKNKQTQERLREKQAAESSLEAYEVNRKKLQAEKAKSKSDFFKEEIPLNNIKIKNDYDTILATKVAVEKDKLANLPAIRNQATIEFEFSARQFPAPKRESNKEQEEQWAKQQKEAKQKLLEKANINEDQTDIDPQELLDKAKKFFDCEDYASALEVYNFCIDKICPDYPPMWNNRAAVHLKLGNLHCAIEDSTKALELLQPAVDANAVMRAKALIRRASALAELKFYNKALSEFQAAAKILPENEGIQSNIKRMECLMMEDSSEDERD